MHRRRPKTTRALIVRTMILTQCLQARRRLIPVKPQPRDQHLSRVQPILQRKTRHNPKVQSQIPSHFLTALSAAQLPYLYIMRRIMCPVQISALVQHLTVMRQTLAPSLIKIDHMHRSTHRLRKPNRRTIPNPQIPPSINPLRRIIRYLRNPTLHLCRLQLLAVNRTRHVRIPTALKLLLILILSHRLPSSRQFLIVQHTRLTRTIDHTQPIRIGRRLLIQLIKRIVTLRRADKHSPTLPVRQGRSNNLRKHILRHLRNLVHHAAVQVNTAQAVRILSTKQRDPPASGQVTPQFRFVKLHTRDRTRKLLEVVPRHVLRLPIRWRHVSIPRVRLPRQDRIPQNMIDRPHRLAKPTVAHNNTPPLFRHLVVQITLQRTWRVGDHDVLQLGRHGSLRRCGCFVDPLYGRRARRAVWRGVGGGMPRFLDR